MVAGGRPVCGTVLLAADVTRIVENLNVLSRAASFAIKMPVSQRYETGKNTAHILKL
jgi:hypothetical protein